MKCLFINTNRTGYAPCDVGETMTVRELIDCLEACPDDDAKVYFKNDNGYTYGYVRPDDLEDGYADEDE